MPAPNMTVNGMKRWKRSVPYRQYKRYHDRQDWATTSTDAIWSRALRVIKGTATRSEEQKVESYISRHIEQEAGERRFGTGRNKVSAHTAALRNWGYDPTGRYT